MGALRDSGTPSPSARELASLLPPLKLTRAELDALPEYSTSLPTGARVGKRWRCDVTQRDRRVASMAEKLVASMLLGVRAELWFDARTRRLLRQHAYIIARGAAAPSAWVVARYEHHDETENVVRVCWYRPEVVDG